MTTLATSMAVRSPGSPILRPLAGYDPPSSSAVVILVSFKRAPGRSRGSRSARTGISSSAAEHGHRSRATRFQSANGGLDGARKPRARSLGCKAQIDSAELEVAEETNGAAVHRDQSEERLLPRKQREIRLESVRSADFAGASISSQVWEWRHRWNIHYESAGMENAGAPALLLLPGFGVGSYHYEHQLRDLGQEYRVWAMDFLGQGKSWPSHDPAPLEEVIEEVVEGQANAQTREWCCGKSPESWAEDLVYSVDIWRDQVHAFIDKVIGGPVYIVGNSLGGYVGTYFAVTSPDLVKGLMLLNATPFWAFMPNARRYPFLSRFVPWAGLLPIPVIAKAAVRVWWNLLRTPKVILRALEMVYADHSAFDDKLVRQMLEATDHPAAFAAFVSILFAPRAYTDFGENLISLKERKTPMCMIYGKEDPWVVPFWGQRTKQRNPEAVYYELSPAGHCPHHEAPEVLNTLLRKWVESVQSQGAVSPLFLEDGVDQKQRHWFVVENPKAGFDDKRVSVRVKGTQGFWRNLLDSIREIFSKRISPQSQVVETVENARRPCRQAASPGVSRYCTVCLTEAHVQAWTIALVVTQVQSLAADSKHRHILITSSSRSLNNQAAISHYHQRTGFVTIFMAFIILDYPGPGAYDPNIEVYRPSVPRFTIPCSRWETKIPVGPGPQTYNIKRTFCTGPAFSIARKHHQRFQRQLPRPPVPPTKKVPRVYPSNRIIYGIGQIKYHEERWK